MSEETYGQPWFDFAVIYGVRREEVEILPTLRLLAEEGAVRRPGCVPRAHSRLSGL